MARAGKKVSLYDQDRRLIGYSRLVPGDRYVSFVRWGDRTFHRVTTGANPERYHEIKAKPIFAVHRPEPKG